MYTIKNNGQWTASNGTKYTNSCLFISLYDYFYSVKENDHITVNSIRNDIGFNSRN